MSGEDLDLLKTLVDECHDLIERVYTALEGLLTATNRDERINEIFRCVHTIKGGAGACDLNEIKTVAHTLENKLNDLKTGVRLLTAEDITAIETTMSCIEELLDNATNGGYVPTPSEPEESGTGFYLFSETSSGPMTVPPPPATLVPVAHAMTGAESKLQDSKTKQGTPELIRVSLERVQRNFDIISEIFLTRNQLKYLVERLANGDVANDEFFQSWEVLDASLRKSIGELEAVALSMRMTSLKNSFKRMEKTITGYASQSGKHINVRLEGSDTELDKKIVDSLSEPLIHLTRNAMDHGIESDEIRKAAGKPLPANILIAANVVGNEVHICVSDDGKGIDDTAVLTSAKRKGLDVSHIKTKEEAINLIFVPGFSTKDSATDVSGRGVGMDAVRTYVESFGGSISIQTTLGLGSLFTMRLPLGMSLLSSLIASVNGRLVAISLAGVVETAAVNRTLILRNEQRSFYDRNGIFIPCIDTHEFLFATNKSSDIKQKEVAICVCDTPSGQVALCFDRLLENAEIVLKTLPKVSASLPYLTGVSILPTGEPVFVLSLPLLYEKVIKGTLTQGSSKNFSEGRMEYGTAFRAV